MLDCSSGTRFPLKVMVLELKFGLMVTVALFPPSVSVRNILSLIHISEPTRPY